MLGKLQASFFPAVFGGNGDSPIDEQVAARQFAHLAREVEAATGKAIMPKQIAQGFIDIAVANMAKAIRQISLERGHDVTRHVLVAFGGAAGQHACLVADQLGITRVMIHPLAGVLSAYGIGIADVRRIREQSVNQPLDATDIDALAAQLRDQLRQDMAAQDVPFASLNFEVTAELSYSGVDSAIAVPLASPDVMRTRRSPSCDCCDQSAAAEFEAFMFSIM